MKTAHVAVVAAPKKETAIEKATHAFLATMNKPRAQLAGPKLRQIIEQLAPDFESDGDSASDCSLFIDDESFVSDSNPEEEELSAKYLKSVDCKD